MDFGKEPRVVLVHDWLTGMRGGEKCLEVLCRRWPEAPLYTLLHRRGSVDQAIENRPLHTSWLQHLPGVHSYYRYLLPLMPRAAAWRLPDCDLVISLSHCVAKSALPPEGVPHLCYCFTPMRYAWHMRQAYFAHEKRGLKAVLRDRILAHLREWDRRSSARVTHFVAISKTVQTRIAECYGRESKVVHPPVDTDFYAPAMVRRQDYYLLVSAFAPYKRLDLALEACRRLQRRVVVIGSGQDARRLRELAGPQAEFLGWQANEVIRDHLRQCRALLFPGEEDFGIVPVEAQACGTPVIAYGRGGAAETIWTEPEPTGVLFDEQTPECLIEAMRAFERDQDRFSPLQARRSALRFHKRRFAEEMFALIEQIAGTRDARKLAA